MKKSIFLVFFLCIWTALSFSETVFGGTGTFTVPLMANFDSFSESDIAFNSTFSPNFTVYDESFGLFSKGSINILSSDLNPSFSLKELYLTFAPIDACSCKIGRFQYMPGSANFFSNTNFFAVTDFPKIVSGDTDNSVIYGDMIQGKLFLNNSYAVLTYEPFPNYPELPDVDSPWFPMKNIPESIHLSFPVEQDLTLGTLTIENQPTTTAIANSALSAETGTTLGPIDLSFLYYHGLDKSLIFNEEIRFPTGLYGSYDIDITRIERIVNLWGFNSTLTAGSFRFWTDISYNANKLFTTSALASGSLSFTLVSLPALSVTMGGSLEYYGNTFSFVLITEYFHLFVFSNDSSVTMPLFSNIAATLLNFTLPGIKTSLNVLFLYSFLDNSFLLNPSVKLTISDELDFDLTVPVFIGDKRSDLGQYKDNHLFSVSSTWRF